MMSAAVRIITITLMMVWNNPLNLPARLSNPVLAFRPEVTRLIAPSQSAGCLILFIYLFCYARLFIYFKLCAHGAGLSGRASGAYRWAHSLPGRGSVKGRK